MIVGAQAVTGDTILAAPAACLARLLPHFRPGSVALTGGLAVHLHPTGGGLPSTRRTIPDLDLAAPDPDSLRYV